MGVFVTGRQVALEIDMPGWWLANASVDMDFRRGLYYDSSTANPRAATDFLSCVRASVGYAKTAEGSLTSFASNALRLTSNGLLIEDARTNLALQSADASTTWTQTNVSVTTNQTAAPDGTTTMDQIFDGVASGRHILEQQITVANAPQTGSCFVKDVDRRYVQLAMANGGNIQAIFDLQTGTITASGVQAAGPGTVFTSATIEAFSNSTYRLTLTGQGDNSTACFFSVALSDVPVLGTNVFGSPSYTGSNKSIYVWGMQLEQASFVSSYIPTTGAAATRAADAVVCIGNLNSIIGGTAAPASAVVDIISHHDFSLSTGASVRILGEDTVTATLLYWASGSGQHVGSYNGSAGVDATIGTGTFTGGVKVGVAWDSGPNITVVGGGGTVGTSAIVIGDHSTVQLGYSTQPTERWYGYFRRLTAWNTKLADATLQGFTV